MKGSPTAHHTLASVAALLAHTIQSYGLEFRPIVRQAGIDPDRYYVPDERLPSGIPRQEEIAHQLNLSLRNLQRKLKGEGTSFKNLIDETRKALAIEYLTTTRKTHRDRLPAGFHREQ